MLMITKKSKNIHTVIWQKTSPSVEQQKKGQVATKEIVFTGLYEECRKFVMARHSEFFIAAIS